MPSSTTISCCILGGVMIQKTLKLNSGFPMPSVGLGTWNSKKGEVGEAVRCAIGEIGYRHIDCAAIYGNEKEIGAALHETLRSKKMARKELFITSKLWNTNHAPADVQTACERTLQDLQLEYLDLYLVHWAVSFVHGEGAEPLDKKGWIRLSPVPLQKTWEAMEKLVEKGLVRSIGVANFSVMMLNDLLTYAKIKPAMNQVELHPYNAQPQLLEYCAHEHITMTAYSPLGSPGGLRPGDPTLLEDSEIAHLAAQYKKTPAQIVLNWGLHRGTAVIPKSTSPQRLKENFAAQDFSLPEAAYTTLDALNRNHRFVHPTGWWGVPYFA
jgi:alcohol dehydrogenase (NADP+)